MKEKRGAFAKEKGKGHPFAGHLDDDEEILWISGLPGLEWRDIYAVFSRRRFYVLSMGLAVLAMMTVLILKNSLHLMPVILVAAAVALILGIGPGLIEKGLLMAYDRYKNPPRSEIYALTNKRLLHRNKYDVISFPLEKLLPISLFSSDGKKGTLGFGSFFPLWTGLEDAAYVKTMIEQAQKRRLEEDL